MTIALERVEFVSMNREQSISEAGRVWRSTIPDIPELKRRIRAAAEAQIEREIAQRKDEAARAIHYALERGATKVSLRAQTTKDHNSFEEYVARGEELAREEGE